MAIDLTPRDLASSSAVPPRTGRHQARRPELARRS
jgi:hypothetical protein